MSRDQLLGRLVAAPPASRGRWRRLAEWGAIALLSVTSLLLLGAGVLAHEVVAVRGSARQAQADLGAGFHAFSAGDLGAVSSRVDAADQHLDGAVAVTRGFVWRAGETLPLVRRGLVTVRRTVETADVGAALAGDMVGQLAAVTAPDGQGGLRAPGGGFNLAAVKRAARGISAVALSPLADHLDVLERRPASYRLAAVGQARRQTLSLGRRLLGVSRDAQALAEIVPAFLGDDQPREYFLAMQNPAELRGTGGLIGFFATLRIADGELMLADPERYEVLDQTEAGSATTGDGDDDVEVPAGFRRRYGQAEATTFLANANLDPDLPTVAPVLLDLYEDQRGSRPDGVIALDPFGLAYAHAPIGPVRVAPAVNTASLPNPLPTGRLARTLMIDAYDVFGGESQARRDYLEAVAESAFRNVASGDWNAVRMLRSLAFAAEHGHLQVYSTHEREQAVFEELNFAGALAQPPGTDLLAVTANNSAGNKSDAHVAHRLRGTIRLRTGPGGTLRREADVRVAVENPLGTTGHDIYIIGSSDPNTGFENAFAGPRGLNRTWFTVWAPESVDSFTLINPDGRVRPDPRVTRLHDLKAVDYTLETQAESTRSFGVRFAGPAPLSSSAGNDATRADGQVVYRLRLHRQTKVIPDRIDLRIQGPDGWRIEGVKVTGGGTDFGLGPDGARGPRMTGRVVDGAVRIAGDMTDDVTVEVGLLRR